MRRDDFEPGDLVLISEDFVPAFPESIYMGCLGVVVGRGTGAMRIQVLVEGSVHQFLTYELIIVEKVHVN